MVDSPFSVSQVLTRQDWKELQDDEGIFRNHAVVHSLNLLWCYQGTPRSRVYMALVTLFELYNVEREGSYFH